MDPTENVRRQLEISNEMIKGYSNYEDFEGAAHELADLVIALNNWITRCGALPAQWDLEHGTEHNDSD